MKVLSSIVLLCSLVVAQAGGVRVGNGTGRVLVGLSLKNDFRTKTQVLDYGRYVTDMVMKDKQEQVHMMQAQGECSKGSSKPNALFVEEFYPMLDGGVLAGHKEYVGYLQVELEGCHSPKMIQSDEPFGGREFWSPHF